MVSSETFPNSCSLILTKTAPAHISFSCANAVSYHFLECFFSLILSIATAISCKINATRINPAAASFP